MKSIGCGSKIENPDSLRGVINRLPYDLRKKWRDTADQMTEDQDREIKFEDIVAFVEKQACAASHPVFGDISALSWDHEREKNTYSKTKGKRFAIKGEDADQGRSNERKEDPGSERKGNPKNCPKCTRDHYLHDCPEFKRESSDERAQFVRSKKLCFNCLKPYPRVQDCRKKRACKDCGRKHSSLLPHPPVAGGNANKDQNSADKQQENPAEQGREPAAPKINNGFIEVEPVLCGFTGMSKVTIGLPVVPVKVTGIGCEKPVITYAFLDNGPNPTFCTEDLLNELGLKGEETSFSLSTIEKQNSKVKCSVVSLVAHNLLYTSFANFMRSYPKARGC